jgi:TfoX/Sxy family transcriptional regulator of competence genes
MVGVWSGLDNRPVRPACSVGTKQPSRPRILIVVVGRTTRSTLDPGTTAGAGRTKGMRRGNPTQQQSSTAWLSAAVSYDQSMAYDEQLADRIRELVGSEADLTERKMFGGLAFLIGGNMAVAASGQGGILVRVDPAQSDVLVATTNARLMEMRGRQMQGWLRVSPEDLGPKRQLARWVELGMSYARSLPAKR